jgi:prepilin-type N-terminal cleavage/methylation domain-containing protein
MVGFPDRTLSGQTGFTLMEIIAVLVIISTIAAIAVPKFIDLDENAKDRAISAGVSELNGRETLTWANLKMAGAYGSDADVFTAIDYWIGSDYGWNAGPVRGAGGGGTLVFLGSSSAELDRIDSSEDTPARWRRR